MAKKSRTREARKRRQQQQRQSQQRLIIGAIIIVAILAIALVIVSNQPTEAVIPTELEARYEGLDRSLSQEGYPRIGNPDAPVTVQEYASFSCPGCEAFHDTSFGAILDRVRTGQVLFVYVPLQTGSIPNAPGAARAALCAGQQGKFWEMHDVLFAWHTQYANTAFTQNRLLAGVDALGLDNGTFTSCFNSQSISNVLDSALGEGVSSTPTIDVNGVTVNAGQSGAIPSTAEVLQAIDDATPRNWSPTLDTDDTDAVETEEPEVEETEAADVEATEEVDETDEDADSQAADDTSDETDEDADSQAVDDTSDEADEDSDDAEAEATEESED